MSDSSTIWKNKLSRVAFLSPMGWDLGRRGKHYQINKFYCTRDWNLGSFAIQSMHLPLNQHNFFEIILLLMLFNMKLSF